MIPSTTASRAKCASGAGSCARFPSSTRARSSSSSALRQTLVELDVQSALPRPGEILAHAVRHQPSPVIVLRVQRESRLQCLRKGRGGEVLKYDAGAAPRGAVVVLHRIGKSAGAPHERYRAVAQAVHLIEPAGLVQRGHEKHVARRLYPVGKFIAVTAMKENPLRKTLLQ